MKEEFLHFVWENQFFDKANLSTALSEEIEIIDCGDRNSNSGPDFLNAKIKIGDIIWVGNVEIHINSSDWRKHKHQKDSAYNNVILHVVFIDDKIINTEKGFVPQTLVLKDRIDMKLFKKYLLKFNENEKVLCSPYLKEVDDKIWNSTLNELLLERLNRKVLEVENLIDESKNDLEWVLFYLVAQSLGLKVNKQPMQMLAQSMLFSVVRKYQLDDFQFSALLFGQAGFLDDNFTEEYPSSLKKEYNYLKHKHNLESLEKYIWKFMRLRPASFPTIRIAQLCAIMSQQHFYSKIKQAVVYKEIKKLFLLELDSYWDTHYIFDKPSVNKKKSLGKLTIDIIIINAIVPYYFLLGKKDEKYKKYAIGLLKEIAFERNTKVKKFLNKGKSVCSAADSQALIQLYDSYCSNKKCLTCSIGKQLMRDD